MLRIPTRRHSLGQAVVMPPVDPFVVPSSPAVPMTSPPATAESPQPIIPSYSPPASPSPSQPTSPADSLTAKIKSLTESPIGKAIAIGGLTAAIAKAFPKRFFVPFVAGSVLSILTGIVPEPTNESIHNMLPFKKDS